MVVGYPIFKLISSRPIQHAPGVLIRSDPSQLITEPVQLNDVAGYEVTQLATYHIHARVLHVKWYADKHSDLAPLDLAVGWGPMSDSAVLSELTLSQSNRFYFYEYGPGSISEAEIRNHSSNIHVIPANRKIAGLMGSLRVGSLVDLRGSLVKARKDAFQWTSSLSRNDANRGACELFLVTAARLINGDESFIDPEDRENLRHWYDLLYAWRNILDLKNPQAVRDFNDEATLYMRTAFPKRTLPPAHP